MKTLTTKTKNKIFLCLTIIMCFTANLMISQTSEQALSDSARIALMTANKYSNFHSYKGINQKFTITTVAQNAVSASDSAQIVNSISLLQGVISCNFYPSNSALIVRTKRENENINIVAIKQVITAKSIFIKNYSDILYQASH